MKKRTLLNIERRTSKWGKRLAQISLLLIGSLEFLLKVGAANPADILLIMPDQMRGDCMSSRGHPVVRTPNLDKLAGQGASFRRAYSTCPSCIPARASLLTGLYPSTSGVVGYAARPITYPTLPQLLADAGYTTALVGRYMHQKPEDEHYGFQTEIRGSVFIAGDDYDSFLKKAAPETGGIRKLVETMGISHNGWEAKPWPLDESLHPTMWTVRQARQFVSNAVPEKPLFLTTSFFSPHPPLYPPKRLFDYYLKSKLPPTAHGDWVDWKSLTTQGDKQGHRVLLEGEKLRAAQAGYFGLTELIDEQIQPLIEQFQERSRKTKRPWLIVFTTDHGEMLGDNGFFRKCEPFEGSANIPFIVAGATELGFKQALVSDQPVCLEDVMPTMLAAAGVNAPKRMDGVNLGPFLRGESKAIREVLHSEHAPCYSKEQAFHALTDGRYKYIWRPLDGTEYLFDLQSDPHEERDLTKVAASKAELEKWRAKLVQVLKNRPEGFSDGTKLIPGRPYPPLQARK